MQTYTLHSADSLVVVRVGVAKSARERERPRETDRERHTDRQTDRQENEQTDRQTGKQQGKKENEEKLTEWKKVVFDPAKVPKQCELT